MAWTVSAENDAAARAGSAGKLYKSDLVTLCAPNSWVTDAIIDYGVTVCPAEGREAGYRQRFNGVFWIEPTVVNTGKDGNDEAFRNTLGGVAALGPFVAHLDSPLVTILPKDANVILFPVNRDNTHWSLLAFYKADRAFVHYDSLEPGNAAAATKLVRRLFQRGYLSRELPIEVAGMQRQADGYNCGVFVSLLARLHMEAGARPAPEAVAAVDSAACNRFRTVMLRTLGPLVADVPAQAGVGEGGKPSSDVAAEAQRQKLEAQIASVEAQLLIEEQGPISLGGMVPCPIGEAGTIKVTLESSEPLAHDFDSAHVIFTVGAEKFARKAVKQGFTGTWAVETKFQADKAFDVEIEAWVTHAAGYTVPRQTAREKGVKAKERREVKFSFIAKADRKIHARFLVEDEGGPRPFPDDFTVEFALDHGSERVRARLDATGSCEAVIPWRASAVSVSFPTSTKWRKLSWAADAAPKSPARWQVVTEKEAGPLVLPPWTWDHQGDEWTSPEQHFGPDRKFRAHLDLAQPDALGSKEKPLVYTLNASAVPSKSFRMGGKQIDHVVVLMLENRGFDHFMGWLYEGADKPLNNFPKNPVGKHAGLRPFEGLDGVQVSFPYDYRSHHGEPLQHVTGVVPLKKGARAANTPKINPHEDFIHILQSMYGKDVIPDPHEMESPGKRKAAIQNADGTYKKAAMNGWAQNYCDGILHHAGEKTLLTHEMISECADSFLPGQLPVMHGLARHYGISDMWFCSVPSQTNTNRSFWITGAAAGLVKNDFYPAHDVITGDMGIEMASDALPPGEDENQIPYRRSLFDVLEECHVSWKYYYTLPWPPYVGNIWPIDLCPQFKPKEKTHFPLWQEKKGTRPFRKVVNNFEEDAKNSRLPAVSYLEPLWGGGKVWDTMNPSKRFSGNEFHPVSDSTYGEFFVKEVYDILFADNADGTPRNPKRDSTVLLITFDENGGTFDHLMPWQARPTGREPKVTQFGFKFDCYGVRVPTLLISKYVPPGTVFRSETETPYDHASVAATILKWRGIHPQKWKLGERVKHAPTFDTVLEHDGSGEDARRKVATGMRAFDQERATRAVKGQELKYGEVFSLRYVGDRWPYVDPKQPRNQDEATQLPRTDWLGGPVSAKNWNYPVGTADGGTALKFKFAGGTDGQPVKVGDRTIIEVVEGPAKGYTLAVPEVMGASCAYLYKGVRKDSRWAPWLWNDRVEGEPLYFGDEVLLMSDRYEPENLTLWYDPYQRLSLDAWDETAPRVRRWARFRAGEWDMWKLEKPVPRSLLVKPSLTSTRFRPLLEGPLRRPLAVKVELKLELQTPPAVKEIAIHLHRSREAVKVFYDEACTKPVAFDSNHRATLEGDVAKALCKGEAVPAWTRADDAAFFLLRLHVSKATRTATLVPGDGSILQVGRGYAFLDGPSRFLQLVDSFEGVGDITSSVPRIRSLSALADMGTDEFVNFAIKRLFIRKGVLDQQVLIKIDGRPVPLMHPLTNGVLPLRYSDFVVDRSGPKFLGALDADVAVEALMYKEQFASELIAGLKKQLDAKGKPLASSFDPDIVQSVRDLSQRRWQELRKELPDNYPDLAEQEIEAATSVFVQKHMAQRKLSDFDLTARETQTLSLAIALALRPSCGALPEELALKIGHIAWSRGGPIETRFVREALAAGARAAAVYEAKCVGAAYVPKKEYKHGAYKGTGYYHILIDEVGVIACRLLEDSMPDVDAGYGLGIPYMGPQYVQNEGRLEREKNPKAEEHDRFEIGDIITDETSHYGSVFSHNMNIERALHRLEVERVPCGFDRFDQKKNLRENVRALVKGSGKKAIIDDYLEREGLIDAVLMFEQVAKKEAQAQLFKATFHSPKKSEADRKAVAGKLMGNVSDVSQFLYGVEVAAKAAHAAGDATRAARMEALKEVVKLSCLIAFPRWSVFARNLEQAKDTAEGITGEMFAKSINERSYAHKKVAEGDFDPEAPRMHVEWAAIDAKIAGQRLTDYAEQMTPVWEFLHQQKAWFQATDALLRAAGEEQLAAARKGIRDELVKVLKLLPNLGAQLNGQEAELVAALAGQTEESVEFQKKRAPADLP